jgi:hypothetical protein
LGFGVSTIEAKKAKKLIAMNLKQTFDASYAISRCGDYNVDINATNGDWVEM